MSDANITLDGMTIQVSLQQGDAWPVALAAMEAARAFAGTIPGTQKASSHTTRMLKCVTTTPGAKGKGPSRSEKIRQIAQDLLADGRVHERREIAQALRDSGMADISNLDGALSRDKRFEKSENIMGHPTYRDLNVPSGYSQPGSGGKVPTWDQCNPVDENGVVHIKGQATHFGKLGSRNGNGNLAHVNGFGAES